MGTVHKLRGPQVTVSEAVEAFLAHYVADLAPKTRTAYSATLALFTAEFGDADAFGLDPDALATWFRSRWGERSASTWNQNRSALKSAASWWNEGIRRTEGQHWGIPDLFARMGGASDTIIWQRQGAMLLSRYLKGRKRGPLFVTERAARRDLGLAAADLD